MNTIRIPVRLVKANHESIENTMDAFLNPEHGLLIPLRYRFDNTVYEITRISREGVIVYFAGKRTTSRDRA